MAYNILLTIYITILTDPILSYICFQYFIIINKTIINIILLVSLFNYGMIFSKKFLKGRCLDKRNVLLKASLQIAKSSFRKIYSNLYFKCVWDCVFLYFSFNNLYVWNFGNLNIPADGQPGLFFHKLVVLRELCLLKCKISQQTTYNYKWHFAES